MCSHLKTHLFFKAALQKAHQAAMKQYEGNVPNGPIIYLFMFFTPLVSVCMSVCDTNLQSLRNLLKQGLHPHVSRLVQRHAS